MLNLFLSILVAIIVIFAAGFLVRWQNDQQDISKELSDKIVNDLGEAVINYISLTGKNPTEETIFAMEQDLQKINKRLCCKAAKSHSIERRRNRHVKRKKNFAND